MHTLPTTIESAIRQQLLTPLAEVLTGQRPARDLAPIVSQNVSLRLSLQPRRSLGAVTIRTVRVQRSGTAALEFVALVTDQQAAVHPLGVRITRNATRAQVVAVATDLW